MTEQPQHDDARSDEDPGEQLVLTSPEEARTPKEMGLWAGVILLVALTVYSPALRGDFLWDDDRHVSQNRNLRDANGLANIWTKFGVAHGGTVQYYPLTHTTFWLEYQLSGARWGEIGTTIFHVTNVVLHVISAMLLWLILRELKVPGSWVAAAIWALHPLQVESVAWISERKNVLAGVFFFGAILAYLRSGFGFRGSGFGSENTAADAAAPSLSSPETRDPKPETRSASSPETRSPKPETRSADGLYWLSLALYLCALLSKTVSVSMPAVVLLLIWWKRGRVTIKDVVATLPFFVIGIGMACVTSWMERTQVGAHGPEWDLSFAQRSLIAGRAIWFYVEKNFVPLGLSFSYRRWNMAGVPATWWFFPIAAVAVAAILFALRKRLGRGPVVAWLIFCGVLTPALGFFNFYPMRYSFVADHFQYLAGPALIALLVAAVAVALRKIAAQAPAAPYVIAGLVLLVLSVLTLMQARVYGGPLLLWDDAIKKNPTSPMLRYNYGSDLMAVTDQLSPQEATPFVEEAQRQFAEAVKLEPKHDRAWTRWGGALLALNKPKEALEKFEQALTLRPDNVDALGGRGRALFELKRPDDAEAAFNQARVTWQEQRAAGTASRMVGASIYQFLGKIAAQRNDLDEAAAQYGEAVKIVSEAPQLRYEYGTVLARLAKMSDGAATRTSTQPSTQAATRVAAMSATRPAAATTPATTMPATTQAATQPSEKTKQLMAAAAAQFAKAIELRPDYVDARVALANLMMDVGNISAARLQLEAAVRVGGNDPPAALREAVQRWDAEFRKREAAATQRATTGPGATRAATTGPVAPLPLTGTPGRG